MKDEMSPERPDVTTPDPDETGDAREHLVEDAGERARSSTMAQLIAEQFSFATAIGGWRGLVESVLPGLVFVVVYVASSSLPASLISSSAVAIVATIVRIIQRTPVTQALAGLVGIAIGVFWAWRSGEAADYFAFGLYLNAAYLVGVLLSIVVRWPVVGIVVGLLRGQMFAWRAVPYAMKAYTAASWIWVVMFALRIAVQLPLYLDASVGWLGTARIVMGVPLWALTLWITWLVVRGIKLPQADEETSG